MTRTRLPMLGSPHRLAPTDLDADESQVTLDAGSLPRRAGSNDSPRRPRRSCSTVHGEALAAAIADVRAGKYRRGQCGSFPSHRRRAGRLRGTRGGASRLGSLHSCQCAESRLGVGDESPPRRALEATFRSSISVSAVRRTRGPRHAGRSRRSATTRPPVGRRTQNRRQQLVPFPTADYLAAGRGVRPDRLRSRAAHPATRRGGNTHRRAARSRRAGCVAGWRPRVLATLPGEIRALQPGHRS